MDFDGFIEKLVRFLTDKEERDMERYKHLGFKEHFHAGVDFRDRQHRSQVKTALISVIATVMLMGSGFVVGLLLAEHMQSLLGLHSGGAHG